MHDRHAAKLRRLRDCVLTSPGALDPSLRAALAENREIDDRLRGYADKLRFSAYTILDSDIDDLRAAGYSEDDVFEATLSVALGTALVGLEAGLRALDDATRES